MTAPTVPSSVEENIFPALLDLAIQSIGDNPWEEARLSYSEVGSKHLTTLFFRDPANDVGRVEGLSPEFHNLCTQMRKTMYTAQPNIGAWYTFYVLITKPKGDEPGTATVGFEMNDEPFLNTDEVSVSREDYLKDLKMFPRAGDYVPSWHPIHNLVWPDSRERYETLLQDVAHHEMHNHEIGRIEIDTDEEFPIKALRPGANPGDDFVDATDACPNNWSDVIRQLDELRKFMGEDVRIKGVVGHNGPLPFEYFGSKDGRKA